MYINKKLNFEKGRDGEGLAKNYLEDIGFKWLESNHVNNLGEIDLIMSDKDILVFVEVKLKIGDKYGTPEEMISRGKLARVKRIAEAYLLINPKISIKFKKYRIDAVCIVKNFNGEMERINHYENVCL